MPGKNVTFDGVIHKLDILHDCTIIVAASEKEILDA
jgi:hypothetical protein